MIAALEPGFAAAIARVGYPAPRVRTPGYETLLRTIVGQQVSVASAAAVWRKLEAELGEGCAPQALLARDFDALRARRLEASKKQVDERLEQRRQDSEGRAEQQAARTAERVEREQELHFELEASVRGCADVLDSTTDYSHITAEDEPDLMVSKNRRRSRGEKDTPGTRRKKTPQERKRERQLVMKKAVQAKAARERAFNTLARKKRTVLCAFR